MVSTKRRTGKPVPGFTEAFGARLRYLISQYPTQKVAADMIEVSVDTLMGWADGRQKPNPFALVALAEMQEMSLLWLMSGEMPKWITELRHLSTGADSPTNARHIEPETQPEQRESLMMQVTDLEQLADKGVVLLPRYDVQASAGRGIVNDGERLDDFLAFDSAHLRTAGINPAMADVIKVEGRSMMPAFVDGELVVVDRSSTDIVTGNIYAVVYQNTLRIKRLQKERSAVVLVSDNKAENYPDERIEGADLNDFRVVGRVRRHIRFL